MEIEAVITCQSLQFSFLLVACRSCCSSPSAQTAAPLSRRKTNLDVPLSLAPSACQIPQQQHAPTFQPLTLASNSSIFCRHSFACFGQHNHQTIAIVAFTIRLPPRSSTALYYASSVIACSYLACLLSAHRRPLPICLLRIHCHNAAPYRPCLLSSTACSEGAAALQLLSRMGSMTSHTLTSMQTDTTEMASLIVCLPRP